MHDSLYFTDHHFQVRDMVRDFAQQVVKPSARRYDLDSAFPWDNVRQMADLGQIGRASCRERVESAVVAVALCNITNGVETYRKRGVRDMMEVRQPQDGALCVW